MKTVGTLKELNVKPGDVVEWCGSKYIALEEPKPKYADEVWAGTAGKGWIADDAEECTVISRAADTPTLWRDMTPEEKGALLLAEYEGENFCIQYQPDGDTSWAEKHKSEPYHDNCAYRRKPEPKVEVVTMYGRNAGDGWYFADANQLSVQTHRITFNTIDGKPDAASIKMEGL